MLAGACSQAPPAARGDLCSPYLMRAWSVVTSLDNTFKAYSDAFGAWNETAWLRAKALTDQLSFYARTELQSAPRLIDQVELEHLVI